MNFNDATTHEPVTGLAGATRTVLACNASTVPTFGTCGRCGNCNKDSKSMTTTKVCVENDVICDQKQNITTRKHTHTNTNSAHQPT